MIVNIQHATKTFDKHVVVDDLSFSIPKGCVFGLLGPNGAGKTTTIRMLTTLLKPTAGFIEVAGVDVTKRPADVRRAIGVVFQDPSHDEQLTAIENMRLHARLFGVRGRVREDRIEQLLQMFDLWERRNDPLKKYSGGMKRRLEIARGLLHTPRLLVLDEPTLGLDPQTRHQLWAQVRHLRKEEQVTVLLTTHYMDEVERVADMIAIIDHGRLVAHGTPKAIREEQNSSSLEEAFMCITGAAERRESPVSSQSLSRMAHSGRR